MGKGSTRDKPPEKLGESPAIMVSGVSTVFSPENHIELCDRLKFLLQEKQAGNNSDTIEEEIPAVADKLLEYKCIFTN